MAQWYITYERTNTGELACVAQYSTLHNGRLYVYAYGYGYGDYAMREAVDSAIRHAGYQYTWYEEET